MILRVSPKHDDRDDKPGEPEAGAAAPVHASGKATAVVTGEADSRSKRISDAAKDALGTGIGTLGDGVSKLGEGVSKLGDLSRKVPVVGSSVSKIGEGISQVGSSLHELPQVARTRRGRLLIRSAIVGFILVAAWIVVIVGLQLHGNDTPDFRPNAERILVDLSSGSIDEVYEQSSPRLQEMARKERFVDDMTDPKETVGKFREITAVNDLADHLWSDRQDRPRARSPSPTMEQTCKVSVSLHYDQGAAGSCSGSASSCRPSSRSRRPSARSGSRRARTRWTSSTATSTRSPMRSCAGSRTARSSKSGTTPRPCSRSRSRRPSSSSSSSSTSARSATTAGSSRCPRPR